MTQDELEKDATEAMEDLAATSDAGDGQSCDAKSDADAALDEQHLVLKRLLAAHEAYFNVFENYEYADRTFPGYAEFESHGEKYVLTKKAKLWEVDAFEYLFFDLVDSLDAARMDDYIAFLKDQAIEKVHPNPSHMTSYLSLVVIANTADAQALKTVRHTRFHKEFKMGFEGWVDMRLAVIDLSSRKVTTNSMGKDMKRSLEANAGFAQGKRKGKLL